MKVVRAVLFWLGIALGVIGLSGLYSALNPDAPTATPIWRPSGNPRSPLRTTCAPAAPRASSSGRWINGEPVLVRIH